MNIMTKEVTFDEIELDNLDRNVYKIGKLSMNVINLLELESDEREIIIWKDRFEYVEKHKDDFENEEQYKKHIEAIPSIIQNPDYVGIHPNGKSIEFIKKIDKHMLVAVRLSSKDRLSFRSSYPIKESKLKNYIQSGRMKKV